MSIFTKHRKTRFLNNCASISDGALRLTTPEGDRFDFGQGSNAAEMHVYDWSAITSRSLGRTFSAGLWDSPDLPALTHVLLANPHAFRTKFQASPKIPHGLDNEFFQPWLDPGMSFTSALFAPGDTDLARAQKRNHDRILGMLAPGTRLLDVGCAWGAMAEHAANVGHEVTGLTQSAAQKGYADARLDGRADIRRQDPLRETAIYDNIVSLEQLNSLSPRIWGRYLTSLRSRLAKGGRIVLQVVTAPQATHDTPSQAHLNGMIHAAGLQVRHSFAFADSYARTAADWQDRLAAQSARLSHLGFDLELQREWRFALATRSARFRTGQNDVVQLALSHRASARSS